MNRDELEKYAQEQGGRFWTDAGNHWLNDDLGLMASSRVIEIGGYLGNWTDYVQRKYECFVDVYEPVEQYYGRLVQRFSNRPKIRVVNAAVEAYQGYSQIAIMDEGSSMYEGGVSSGPKILVTDIACIVKEIKWVDLLAVNGEGCEYPILDRLIESEEIGFIGKLLVQFHAFFPDADARRASIRERLAKTHYENFSYPFCWERWVRK